MEKSHLWTKKNEEGFTYLFSNGPYSMMFSVVLATDKLEEVSLQEKREKMLPVSH